MEDKKIIDLFWERDEKAIAAASDKYYGLCYRMAWNVLSDRRDAEECVNDTWFDAWKKIPPHRPNVLSSFLVKIVRCRAIDSLRKRCAGKRPEIQLACMEELEILNTAISQSMEEKLEREELLLEIDTFLCRLSAKNRDIFLQRYWKMEPLKEIAKRHHCSEGAVKQSLFHTRKKLYKRLESEGML